MSDSTKFEFITLLDKFEELSATFDTLQAQTEELKKEYAKDPNNPDLLERIRIHEEKYKYIYEQFKTLNLQSEELKKKSDEENND